MNPIDEKEVRKYSEEETIQFLQSLHQELLELKEHKYFRLERYVKTSNEDI